MILKKHHLNIFNICNIFFFLKIFNLSSTIACSKDQLGGHNRLFLMDQLALLIYHIYSQHNFRYRE